MPTVDGTNEDDTLYGTGEDDSISGFGGNDTLVGFGGADLLDGGDGIDSAFYFDSAAGVGVNLATGQGTGGSAQGDTLVSIEHLWGSSYNDTFTGNDEANDFYGLDGNDVLKGGGGADGLDGGSGDDILKGGGGADVLVGGTGNDTADYSQSPATIPDGDQGVSVSLYPGHFPGHGVGGDAQYDTYFDIENVTGSAFQDYLTGNDDANVLRGLDGNDRLTGEGGNDVLDGGNGADQLTGGLGDDFLRGGAGADELNGAGGSVTVEGSDTADYSEKTDGVSVTLNSFIVVNVYVGGVLEDTMRNIENVIGGSGNDILVGDYRANVFNGGAGNDVLNGGGGIDTLYGGDGNDIYYVDNSSDQAIETSAAGGIDNVSSSVTFVLRNNVENLYLTGDAAITATGNSLNNILAGNSAANTLNGGDGNDTLNGGAGVDTMYGGSGDDSYYVDNALDRAIEGAALGTDRVVSSVTFTLGANVENLTLTGAGAIDGTGNALGNVIIGNSGANTLDGGLGADNMNGGQGNDTYYVDDAGDRAIEGSVAWGSSDHVISSVSFLLGNFVDNLTLTGSAAINGFGNGDNNTLIGNSGNNILSAAAGNDSLNGAVGIDHLYGGLGNDSLTGGAGADRFIFNTALNAATNLDVILDFSVADDTIALDQTIFSALPSSGTLAASAFHVGAGAADADDRIIYDSATGRIYYDADGNGAGAQVLFAQIGAGFALTNADFILLP